MRQLRQWHWISGAISLISMLLFAITGITLNHSSAFESKAATDDRRRHPRAGRSVGLAAGPKSGRAGVSGRARGRRRRRRRGRRGGPRSRMDGWRSLRVASASRRRRLGLDRARQRQSHVRANGSRLDFLPQRSAQGPPHGTGVEPLHRRLRACAAWSSASRACLLLQMYANGRPSTWPVVAAGLAIPVLLALFLIH